MNGARGSDGVYQCLHILVSMLKQILTAQKPWRFGGSSVSGRDTITDDLSNAIEPANAAWTGPLT